MLRINLSKGLCISFFLSIASVLHAQEVTPQPFWHCHDVHLDIGTMLFLKKHNNYEKKGKSVTEHTRISFGGIPFLLVDIGWKWTDTMGKGFCYQAGLYYSTTHYAKLIVGWPLLIMPDARLSVGYLNSKEMLFTLGIGTKEFIQLCGSLTADVPLSKHFYLTVEAAHLFKRGTFPQLRITAKLGYKF